MRSKQIAYFAPHLIFMFLMFALTIFFRFIFICLYYPRLTGCHESPSLFLMSMRLDLVTVSYLVSVPFFIFAMTPDRFKRFADLLAKLWMAGWLTFALFLEIGTPAYMAEFDVRPNRLFIEVMFNSKEILTTIYKLYILPALFIGALLICTFVGLWRLFSLLTEKTWTFELRQRALALFLLPFLVLGARGTLKHRPLNTSSAALSRNHLANELALNSTFSLLYSVYSLRHEIDPAEVYGKMPREEAIARVRKYLVQDGSVFVAEKGAPPFLRHYPEMKSSAPMKNIVFILEESLGAEYVGSLGGFPLTPRLDALANEGLFFEQLYCTGTRTVRGIEATVSSFLPTPGRSVVKLSGTQRHFFTAASYLKKLGYNTMFIYGGQSNFDNMASFLRGNGFDDLVDENDYKNPEFKGTWGVCDEDLFTNANDIFKRQKLEPFFALLLTTSNHSPFEFPKGKIVPYEQPLATRKNAMKYADYALGKFFEMAKKEAYYRDTIFVVVADHDTRVYGHELVPIEKFHIPALIIGPNVPRSRYADVASQLDLLPTVLALAGTRSSHPCLGRDVLALREGVLGRAIMQYYENNAFMVGNRVVIHLPHKPPQAFVYDGKLTSTSIDEELAKDALAHAIIPGVLLREQGHSIEPHKEALAMMKDPIIWCSK